MRCEHERHAVGDPAGRVLVDGRAGRDRRTTTVSPESIIALREGERLLRVESPEQARP